MALQTVPSAAVKMPGSVSLPGAVTGKTATSKGHFLALFSQKLDSAADDSSVISRLASLLQNGTPMATITNRIAAELTNALARAVGEPGDAKARSTLQRALAAALAPPGSGPPTGSPQEQAAMLEGRVKDLLTTLTSELNTAGQKSEFSGKILDAKPAKDTPAPQKSTTTSVDQLTDDVAAFVQSLLNGAAGDGSSTQAVSATPPSHSNAVAAATLQPNPPLPDLLTRMVSRAVNAEAQRNPAATRAPAQPVSANTSHAAATAAFQRMIAILGNRGGTQTGTRNEGEGQTQQQQKMAEILTAPQPAAPAASSSAQQTTAAASAFAAHLPQSVTNTQAQAPATPYTTVDPNAVVEQIVKGIVVRNAGTTSEIRLRLQPEQLGDVSLKLTVSGNTIAANVVAQNAHVRDMLMANQQQLARSLASAGLSLGNFSVDVSGGNAGFTGQGSHQQRHTGGNSRVFGAMLIGEDENWGDTRFGPPVVTGPTPIVLNHLA